MVPGPLTALLLAAASAAAGYEARADYAALLSAAQACTQALNGLNGVPVEPAKAAALHAALDEARVQAEAAARAAGEAAARVEPFAAEVSSAVAGKGSRESLDRRAAAAREAARRQAESWKDALARARDLSSASEDRLKEHKPDPKDADSPKERERLEARAKAAKAVFSEIDEAKAAVLAASDLTALEEARSDCRQEAFRADAARDELASAAYAARAAAAACASALPAARAAVDGLGVEPLAQSRTLAYRRLTPVQEALQAAFQAADAAKNRAAAFEQRHRGFLKAYASFEAQEKAARSRREDADKLYAPAAERLLRLTSDR